MTRVTQARLFVGRVAVAVGTASAAFAAAPDQATPKGWNYDIKDGKRVPKADRVTNADGSWREEVKQGNCVTVKEMSPSGELKITRKCD